MSAARAASRGAAAPAAPRLAPGRFALRVLAWSLPAALLWLLLTPFYNLFLVHAAERLVRLGERPSITQLELSRGHHAVITRSDTRAGGRLPYSFRITDVHFPLVLLLALLLAVPDLPGRERLSQLGYGLLLMAVFHVVDVLFWVKFAYATQLGDWSLRHYGPWARNFWGMGKHLLDLPVKLALPLLIWCWFHLGRLSAQTSR
jgi:hypothetical protein